MKQGAAAERVAARPRSPVCQMAERERNKRGGGGALDTPAMLNHKRLTR